MSYLMSADTRVTDLQRDRAVEVLQQAYATGAVTPELFEDRLGQALTAETRADLNASLRGIARLATPAATVPSVARAASSDPLQNIGAGLTHLSGIGTSAIGPAIVKAVSTPGSRLWLEASRALAWQLSMLVLLVVGLVLAMVTGHGALLPVSALAWFFGTIALAARATGGHNSTAPVARWLPVKPEPRR